MKRTLETKRVNIANMGVRYFACGLIVGQAILFFVLFLFYLFGVIK